MLNQDKSDESRIRALSTANLDMSVAINNIAPTYQQRKRLLSAYGLENVLFFKNHLNKLELTGCSLALSQSDILDRYCLTNNQRQVVIHKIQGHSP
jgi:hypothetical protein